MKNLNIDELIKKYWEGETSLEEERTLKTYLKDDFAAEHQDLKTIFSFFSDQREIRYPGELKGKKTKVIKANFIRNIAVAASIFLISGLGIYFLTHEKPINKEAIALSEIKDPDEALEITREALAFLSVNYAKGEKTIAGSISKLEKLDIIKSN